MPDLIRRTLIESKMQVLEALQVHINSELETYRKMLEQEPENKEEK